MISKLIKQIYSIFVCMVYSCEGDVYRDINKSPEHSPHATSVVLFQNDFNEPINLCWIQKSTENGIIQEKVTDVCQAGNPGDDIYFTVTVGSKFKITTAQSSKLGEVLVVGGKHRYSLRSALTETFDVVANRDSIVHVRTPSMCEDYYGYPTLGITFRDGVRVAAFRHSYALCLCGEFNTTSSFTVDVPNSELPIILSGEKCDCDGPNVGAYDLWVPCNFMGPEPRQLVEGTNCEFQSLYPRIADDTRLFLIHTTTEIDRLSLKNKLWESLKNFYGVDRASLIMPRAYWIAHDHGDLQSFVRLCQDIVSSGRGREHVFIMKNVYQHQQKGISLSSAQQLINNGLVSGNVVEGFSMATEFIPRPYLVKGYKLNMRRYMVAVCTGNRLRGYVHDDGKNIYTKKPYREPWEGEEWESNRRAFDLRLEELITTGYVQEDHYNDKPLSGLEFFNYTISQGKDPSLLQLSMWERLALSLHMSIHDEDFNLCDVHPLKTRTREVPSCLHNAVRFQHFGCDFHIDSALTGYESRLFECNKGPDMSVHSYRDGKMKRDVAADIMSFIGFKGRFDGSAEYARKHKMNLIYDSETYDPETGFVFLNSLDPAGSNARTGSAAGVGEL